MLLLHEFHRRKFLLPDKLRSKDREQLVKAAARAAQPGGDFEEDADDKPGKPRLPASQPPSRKLVLKADQCRDEGFWKISTEVL